MRDICRKLSPQILPLKLLCHIHKQDHSTFCFLSTYHRIGNQLDIASI